MTPQPLAMSYPIQPTPLPDGPPSLSLGALLGGAWARRWTALFVGVLLGGAIGFGIWTAMPAEYSVSALVHFRFGPALTEGEKGLGKEELENQQRTQLAILKSTKVLDLAVKSENCKELNCVKEQVDAAAWLGRELKAGFYEGTAIMWLSMTGQLPGDLAALVNAACEQLRLHVVEVYNRDLQDKVDQYTKAIDKLDGEIRSKRATLKPNAVVGIDPTYKAEMEAIANTKAQLTSAEFEVTRRTKAIELLKKRLDSIDKEPIEPSLIDEIIEPNPRLLEANRDLKLAQKIYEDNKKAVGGADVPAIKPSKDEFEKAKKAVEDIKKELIPKAQDRIRTRLRSELRFQIGKAEDELALAQSLVTSLGDLLARLPIPRRPGGAAPDQEMTRAEVEQSEIMLGTLRMTKEKLNIEKQSTRERVTVQQSATPPTRPNTRAQWIRAGAGGLAGLVIGILGIGLLEFRSRRVRDPGPVVAGTGLRVLGAIPAVSSRELATAGPKTQWNVSLAIAVDLLRTTLQLDDNLRSCRSLVVTSASESEGKSTLALMLAVSLARSGFPTVLIDADFRYPDLHERLNVPIAPGLSDVIRSPKDWERVSKPVDGLPLSFIPAGSKAEKAISRLTRVDLAGGMNALRKHFSYVIIDAPPTLPVPEAAVLGKAADGVIICARSGSSKVEEVTAAVRRLTSLGVNCLGLVFNGVAGRSRNYPAYGNLSGPGQQALPPIVAPISEN